ncbi:hypothetical protein [Dyadobacter psychrophilus]|nr:hypothetical protein [Dyadobacter psychrophilus]
MQTRKDILEKLESVTAAESSQWKERAARKAENPKALEKSRIIAIGLEKKTSVSVLSSIGVSKTDFLFFPR